MQDFCSMIGHFRKPACEQLALLSLPLYHCLSIKRAVIDGVGARGVAGRQVWSEWIQIMRMSELSRSDYHLPTLLLIFPILM